MGGGPRTYPGGVSKWQWKRMQDKKAKQLLKARLCRERQIYEMRKRAELKAAVADLERPWEVVERAPKLFSVNADEQLKVLADRFQRPGGFDLWTDRDGPQLFQTPDGVPSARFFPKGVVHSVKPYGKIEGFRELESDSEKENGDGQVSDVGYNLAKKNGIAGNNSRGNLSKNKLSNEGIDFEYGRKGSRSSLRSGQNRIDHGEKYVGAFAPSRDDSDNKINRTQRRVVNGEDRINRTYESPDGSGNKINRTLRRVVNGEDRINRTYESGVGSGNKINRIHRGIVNGEDRINRTYESGVGSGNKINRIHRGVVNAEDRINRTYESGDGSGNKINRTRRTVVNGDDRINRTYESRDGSGNKINRTHTRVAIGDDRINSTYESRDDSGNKKNRTHTRVENGDERTNKTYERINRTYERTNRTYETANRRASRCSKGDMKTQIYDLSLQEDGSYSFQPKNGKSDF